MPRMQLTDAEAEYIEAMRRKNAAAIAHNRALEIAINLFKEWCDKLQVGNSEATRESMIVKLQEAKEVIRP